jgi:hypothetical protein
MAKQCTVCFHVNDCKISHERSSVVDEIIKWRHWGYESIFTDGSGKMKVSRGEVHKYLGMTLDFSSKFVIRLSLCEYADNIVKAWDAACLEFDGDYTVVTYWKKIRLAAPEDLFRVDDNEIKFGPMEAKCFHNIVAKTLYVTKQAKPNTAVAVAYLTPRVREPDFEDWHKLRHLM